MLMNLIPSLTKAILFYPYFITISMLSHPFFPYFLTTKLYFTPILLDKENRASILFVFYFYFKSIFQGWYILSLFSHNILKNSLETGYFNPILHSDIRIAVYNSDKIDYFIYIFLQKGKIIASSLGKHI